MAIISNKLVTVGGYNKEHNHASNSLLTLSIGFFNNAWTENLPPMSTCRMDPAVVSTDTFLVVAGGSRTLLGNFLSTVEVLDLKTRTWSYTCSLPQMDGLPQLTLCNEALYVSNKNNIHSCSVEALLDPTFGKEKPLWTRLANIPVPYGSSLVTLRGHVLSCGGADQHPGNDPTGAVHCYDAATNSWSVVGEMMIPRYCVLAAVLPGSHQLVVVGGMVSKNTPCCILNVANSFIK